ncbi:hypothetical protein B0H10DRAFT_1952937 [Mycena sp. CBHHK59/15]|nr:hypothetical protein B0H10DRAFT_1952937 [Mycena sp. CBHHK59/15]
MRMGSTLHSEYYFNFVCIPPGMQKVQHVEDVDESPRKQIERIHRRIERNERGGRDFSNPLVREYLHFYLEITTTVSESWQAEKYAKEIEDDGLSPMWANWDGTRTVQRWKIFCPLKWIVYLKQVHCDAYLTKETSRIFTVEEQELVRVLATDLRYNFFDLRAQGEIKFSGVQNTFTPHTPHPVREIAQGWPVFVLRIMPWADDDSGNRSKQYNAHMNMYIANINLPHKLLSQEYFVRFCATSQHASSLEQFDALAEDCMQKGVQ